MTAVAPPTVIGSAGGTVQYAAHIDLTSAGITTADGALGYSVAVGIEGGTITDVQPSTAVQDLFATCAGTTWFFHELTSGPGNEGAIASAVFCIPTPATLPPSGTENILDLTVEADVPPSADDGSCAPNRVRLFPTHGLQGSGDPINSVAVYRGDSYAPTLVDTITQVCPEPPGQLPGDCNQDLVLDVADPVCIALVLFSRIPPDVFPCGDGTAAHSANIRLLDWNGDGAIDISDIVGELRHIFLGAPDHVLGDSCVSIRECPDLCDPPSIVEPPEDTPTGVDNFPSAMGLNLVDDDGNLVAGAGPIVMHGPVTVVKGEPFLNADGHWVVPTEMVALELSSVAGDIGLSDSAMTPSRGQIVSQQGPDGPFFPCDSFFDVFVEIDLPGLFAGSGVLVRVEARDQLSVPGCDCYRTPENFHAENPGAGPNLAGGHLPCPPECDQELCRSNDNPCP